MTRLAHIEDLYTTVYDLEDTILDDFDVYDLQETKQAICPCCGNSCKAYKVTDRTGYEYGSISGSIYEDLWISDCCDVEV